MNGQTLWVRGLRGRPLTNGLIFLLSSVAVLTAVLGPLLVRAIEQSAVADATAAAGTDGTAITVFVNRDVNADQAPLAAAVAAVVDPVGSGPAAALFEPPQEWIESIENVAWATPRQEGSGETVSRVRVADEICATIPLTAGRCPAANGEFLISVEDARAQHLQVGSKIIYRLVGVLGAPAVIVGTYDPDRVDSPLTRPGTEAGRTAVVTGDPLVLTRQQVTELQLATQISGRLRLRHPATLADEVLLRQTLADLRTAVFAQPVSLSIDTELPDVLDRVDNQSRSARVLVGIAEAQALALALFALAVVLHRIATARAAEWGTGRLLGVSRRRWFTTVYAEPAVALVAGLPVGFAAGVLVARLSAGATLRPGTPIEPGRWPVLVAALGVALVALLAVVAVSAPSIRRPLAELIGERSESRRISVVGAVAQSAAVLLAAATGYALLAGGVLTTRGPQLGLLAPALFALALAVIAVRIAVLVVRRVTRRPTRSVVALVVGRQAARTPSTLNPAIVVAVGVALSVFATQVLALSVRNQGLRADAVVGADTVLRVGAPVGTDLTGVVHAADPTGRYAMAVQERASATDTGTGRIVAVDSQRLAAVAAWSSAWAEAGDLATVLHPATAAPIELRGSVVDLRVAAVDVKPGIPLSATKSPADPVLTLTVNTGPSWRTVRLGPVDSGGGHAAAIPCEQGCRLVGLGLVSGALQPYRATFTVTGIATDQQAMDESTGWLTQKGRWQSRVGNFFTPDPDARATPTVSPAGLTIQASDAQGGNAALVAPTDVADPLPAVVGPDTEIIPFPGIDQAAYGKGMDGNGQLIRVVGRATVLPRAVDDGVLVDLANATALSDPANFGVRNEVWLAPHAPASIESALTAAGLTIEGRERLVDVRATQLRQPMTRGAAVAVVLAYAALALAFLALVAARVADVRRRRADLETLRFGGLRDRTVRRLVAVEIAAPALVGAAVGVVSGLVALRFSAARLPLVDLSTVGPPLDLGITGPPVAVVALVVVVAVGLVAAVGARLEPRAGARR